MIKFIEKTLILIFLSAVPTVAFSSCAEGLFESTLSKTCLSAHPDEDAAAFEKPMSFVMRQITIRPEGTWIAAEGIITKNTPEEFRRFLRENLVYKENRIEFNSPGGNLYGAIELGRIIRRMGNPTTVGRTLLLDNPEYSMDVIGRPDAVCFSACAYAFLGGEKRYLSDNALFGVHRFGSSEYGFSSDEAQQVSSDLARYIEEMGADQRLLQLAARTSFEDDIFLINSAMAEELRVVFDPSIRSSRFEISLLGQNIVANTTIFHQGYEYSARLHCIDRFPRLVVWGPKQNFPQIFYDMPKAAAKFISGRDEFIVRSQASTLKNGNVFVTFDGVELAIQLITNGELQLNMVWPPNWDQLESWERIKWADMALWFSFHLRIENAPDTIPIILKECQ